MLFDIGYALSALGYFALVLLILVGRKTGLAKRLLLASTLCTALWAVPQIGTLGLIQDISQYAQLDSLRLWIWSLFLCACLQNQFSNFWHLLSRPATLRILILPSSLVFLAFSGVVSANLQFLAFTLVTIQMLVILEQVFRQSAKFRWEYKPLIIYLGALTTFDFFTYANAAMVNQLNWSFYAARGFIYLAMLPFLVLAIKRIQHWGIDIFVSREVVMHSTLLMLSGAYLVIMALLGYLVNYFGGEWGAPIQLILFLISIVLLISLFLSNDFRTRLKVFITKNFYANQFDYRVEWLALTQTLTLEDKRLSEVYRCALKGWMQGIKYDQGMLLKQQNSKFVCLAEDHQGSELAMPDRDELKDLGHFLSQKHWIVDFDEMHSKPDLYQELPNRNALMQHFGFQIAVPIFQQQKLWGMVLLNAKDSDKRSLNWELRDYLQALTEQTANFIFQAESSQALAENAQFAAFSRMSAFVVHDLKNVLAQINLLLANADKHKHNPEFIEDTFETLGHTKARMDKMLKQLMDKSASNQDKKQKIVLNVLIEDLIEKKCKALQPHPSFSAEETISLEIDADKLNNVLYHLISNAQQATNDSGEVSIKLSQTSESILIDIQDDGTGMSAQFIETRLFKPFETTKGNAGMGVGAYDAKQYIEGLGGSIDVHSVEGEGSLFTLHLPKIREEK